MDGVVMGKGGEAVVAMMRSGAALVLVMLASAVLNTAMFPEVAQVSPLSREVSTMCGALFSVLVAVAAYLRPEWMRERLISAVLVGLLAVSLVVLNIGLAEGNDALVMLGSPFGGIGMVWFSVLLGVALTRLPLRETFVVVPAAYVISYGAQFALSLGGAPLSRSAAALIYFAAIVGSYLLIAGDVHGLMGALRKGASPTVLDATNPSSFLPFSSFVYVTILIFNAACGFEMAQTGGTLTPTWEVLSFLPVGLVLIAALGRPRGPLKLDTLHTVATVLVFAGLLLVLLRLIPAAGNGPAAFGGAALLRGGSDVFVVLTYFLIAALGSRNPTGALTASAFAFSASWLGIVTGAVGQSALKALLHQSTETTPLITMAIIFAFVVYNFVCLRNRSFDASVAAVVPAYVPEETADGEAMELTGDSTEMRGSTMAPEDGAPSPTEEQPASATPGTSEGTAPNDDARIDRGCLAVAKRFGLTSREEDVLALLARGRTSPVIQKKLTVSHNTVKSHVRHIYAKLGVHSQQELIDLVDEMAVS